MTMEKWKKIEPSDEKAPTSPVYPEKFQNQGDTNNDTQNQSSHDLERGESKKSEIDPFAEPPDGGLNAWLKVLGAFLLYSNIWGFTISFGAFQTYYEHGFLSNSSPSAISWIGTVQSWLLILVGALSGPLFDLGWFRPMLFLGNFGVIFGIFMLSLARTYWQVFLAQGVCMGLGAGMLYIPSLALIGLSFSKKRAFAQGIVTSGIAVGGVTYIISFDRITSTKGFGWAVRVMGFIALVIALIALPALLKGTNALAKARTARKLYDPGALKDFSFVVFTIGCFATFLGYIVPYFYIPSFAQDVLGISKSFALSILIMGIAASFLGRLSAGIVAQFLGPLLTWVCCATVSGVLSISWIAVSSQNGLITFSVFWGFCSAGLVTLPAVVFPNFCPDQRRLGTRTGMSWGISSFASLIGSPIAGALMRGDGEKGEKPRSNYLGVQLWSGCCLLVGAGILALLWITTVRRRGKGLFI